LISISISMRTGRFSQPVVRDKEAEQWTSKVMPSQEGKEINLRRSLISAGLWLHKL
jgi:hypothetical protein